MKNVGFTVLLVFALIAHTTTAQEPIVATPESIVAQGVPPIAASIVETAGRYASYRGARVVDWHPKQLSLLIATRFAETEQLHLVAKPEADRKQLTFFADAVGDGLFHPNSGDYIVFTKDVGGGEWYQVYRYDTMDGKITLLTDGKSRNVMGSWSSKGDHLAYMSTRRTGKDLDLWVINPRDPKSDRLVAKLDGGGWQALDWSPDDSKIMLLEELSINESYLWLVDIKTGEKTPFTDRDSKEKISYGGGKFSKDGKGFYVTTDLESEFHRLAFVNLVTREHTFLTSSIPWDVDGFDLSQDGKRIAFMVNQNGSSQISLLNTATGAIKRTRHPDGVIGGLSWHRNSKDIAFSLNNATTAGDAYSLNADSLKLTRWTNSESAVPTANFSPAQLIQWKSFDGKSISGFMYNTPTKFTGKRPVLVVIHGGPEGQSQASFLGRNNYLLNELGITVIYPNVRGSTGYGKTFSLLDNGFEREDTYKDINALFDWISTQSNLDASRVAVMGGSYGGHMSLAISAFYSDRIRCSIDIVGISNFVTFLEHTEAYRQDLRRVEYGDEREPKMREFLERIAPMNHIDSMKKPMLVIAGKNDPRVPLSESDQIVAALKKQGTPVWYIMAKDEGHGFGKKANQDYQFYATIKFLEEFLLK